MSTLIDMIEGLEDIINSINKDTQKYNNIMQTTSTNSSNLITSTLSLCNPNTGRNLSRTISSENNIFTGGIKTVEFQFNPW